MFRISVLDDPFLDTFPSQQVVFSFSYMFETTDFDEIHFFLSFFENRT